MSGHASSPEDLIYPVGLRLAGRRVIVVGGGPVAARRVVALVAAGADTVVVSPSLTTTLGELVDAGRVAWWERRYADGDVSTAWYVVAATADPEVNAAVMAEAIRARTFCVRADDAAQASAWTLATGRYGDLTVAVSGGGDPRRAALVRDGIVAALADGTIEDRPHRAREI